MWIASLQGRANLRCVLSGLLRTLELRPGDAVLAVSVSGEFRDLIEASAEDALPRPLVAVTATARSTLARHADAFSELAANEHGTETHPQDEGPTSAPTGLQRGCLAVALAQAAGLDPDRLWRVETYLATARVRPGFVHEAAR